MGFHCSRADISIFVRCHTPDVQILLLYVDDIIVTGSLGASLSSLGSGFDMKDLGDLHFLLGMEVKRSSTTLTLTQTKYTIDLLRRTDLLEAKPISTPVVTGSK